MSNIGTAIDSLASLINLLNDNSIDNDLIYQYLGTVDIDLLSASISQFKKIDAEEMPEGLKGKAAKEWNSDKNSRKGKAFEKILEALLAPGGRCFSAWTRLQTATNELDFLVALEPLSSIMPMLREWGTHFICECKSTEAFSTTWLQKLYTVLGFHNATVGIVLSKKRPSKIGNGARAHNAIGKAALLGKTLVTIDIQDAEACLNGTRFLSLLRDRYVEIRASVDELKMIAGL